MRASGFSLYGGCFGVSRRYARVQFGGDTMHSSFKTVRSHRPWEDTLLRALIACGWCDGFREAPKGFDLGALFAEAFLQAADEYVGEKQDDALSTHLYAFVRAVETSAAEAPCQALILHALSRNGFVKIEVGEFLRPRDIDDEASGPGPISGLAIILGCLRSTDPAADFIRTKVQSKYFGALRAVYETQSSFRKAS